MDKIKGKKEKFTREERLEFEKKKIDEQLAELKGKEADKDTPVTVGMLEDREREKQKGNALDLAEAIEDETERELVIHQLETTITSGSAEERVKVARGYVNSLRNAQIAEELARQKNPKPGTPPGAPPKTGDKFEPTPEEAVFMAPPYNLKKEDILKSREKAQKE